MTEHLKRESSADGECVEFDVNVEGEGLMGEPFLTLRPNQSAVYELVYSPRMFSSGACCSSFCWWGGVGMLCKRTDIGTINDVSDVEPSDGRTNRGPHHILQRASRRVLVPAGPDRGTRRPRDTPPYAMSGGTESGMHFTGPLFIRA